MPYNEKEIDLLAAALTVVTSVSAHNVDQAKRGNVYVPRWAVKALSDAVEASRPGLIAKNRAGLASDHG